MHECLIPGVRAKLLFTVNKVDLSNINDNEVIIPSLISLACFYKGSWISRKDNKGPGGSVIPFAIESETDVIHYAGRLQQVKTVLEQQRTDDPTKVKIAYHVIEDAPTVGDPGALKISQKYEHHWKYEKCPVKDEITEVQHAHVASLILPEQWQTSMTSISWVMRWTAKGLTPVRPMVVTTRDIKIDAKTVVELM